MATATRTMGNSGVETTTNATPVTMGHIALPEASVTAVEAFVAAKSTTNVHAAWRLFAACRRDNGGAPAVVGAVVNILTPQKDPGAALWDATFVLNGNGVVVQVTGAAGVTISWFASFDARVLSLN